jgi:hypothetical protein
MERIDLANHQHECQRSWESWERGHRRHIAIEVGTLVAGTVGDNGAPLHWYASRITRRETEVWASQTEREVCQKADGWIRKVRTGWRETTGQDA